jgi:hypothetical protein
MGASGFPGKREDPILAGIIATIFMIKDPIRLINKQKKILITKARKYEGTKEILSFRAF